MNTPKLKMRPKNLITCLGVLIIWTLVSWILYPALRTLQVSFVANGHLSLFHYIQFFAKESSLQALFNSIQLGLLTVIICGLIGTTLAFMVHFFEMPYKGFFDKILLLPMMLPGLIIVFSFVQLYGESGIVTQSLKMLFRLKEIPFHFTGLSGILFVHAYTQYVYFYLNVSIAIKHMDVSAIEAGRNMGANK